MKVKRPFALVIAVVVCQMAGIVGAFFTTPAIPTWYMGLNKPSFNPPSWVFGPVWTILYTLMGISVYKIWLKGIKNKKVSFAIKLFGIHLILNSLWSIIFFGAKNLGLAFVEIVILWVLIIYVIKLFWKIEKLAGILLLPYLVWVSFATILNLSIWTLNPKAMDTFAQEFNYKQAYSDYTFTKDDYQDKLTDFNKKKDSYQKNPTLSLKEEARLSLYDLMLSRNDLLTSYFTALRLRILESAGLSGNEKNLSISKISEEDNWFKEHKIKILKEDSVEELIIKSEEEDTRINNYSTTAINYALVTIGYGDVVALEQQHKSIYEALKNEANNLVELGRADLSLFERWFLDIEAEFDKLPLTKASVKLSLDDLTLKESYAQKKGFEDSIKNLEPAKASLLKINNFLYELENVIEGKR